MNTTNWRNRTAAGAVAAVCLFAAGCNDDDDGDSSPGPTVVATNVVVSGGQTNVAIITNLVDSANEDADNEAAPNGALVAPQLLSPANGKVYLLSAFVPKVSVSFEWTAVPGAANYVFRVGELAYLNGPNETSISLYFSSPGAYEWSVLAWDADEHEGPRSVASTFVVKRVPLAD